MKALIRNASVYRANVKQNEAEFRQALTETAFVEPSPSQSEAWGFVPVEGEFLRTFPGGYGFTLRIDQKVVPPSALKAETSRLIALVEDREGRKPGRKEAKEIKAEALHNLTLKALSRSTHVNAYYHVKSETLVAASTSQRVCDRLTSHLVHALETIKTSTVHVSVRSNLTARLQQWVADEGDSEAFGELTLTGRAALQSPHDKRTLTVKSDDIMVNFEAIQEASRRGYEVKGLSVQHDDLEFFLTDTFKFCALNNREVAEFEDSEGDNLWAASAFMEVTALVKAVNALCEMFGHGEEAEADAE